MSFDGIVFKKVIDELNNKIINTRINKIYQVSNTDFVFALFSKGISTNLYISISNTASYISLYGDNKFNKIENSHFTTSLFYHLVNGKIVSIEQINNDRIAKFTINKTNELGISKISFLYVELTGKLTNLILTKDDNTIIDCVHKIGITAARTLFPGIIYNCPNAITKNNIYDGKYDENVSLENQFGGMSKNLIKEINFRLSNGESFKSIVNLIKSSDSIYINKTDFHLIPLSFLSLENVRYNIFDGLNKFYSEKNKFSVNDDLKDLLKVVNRELKKYINKKEKLSNELIKSSNFDKYRLYADLIFSSEFDINSIYREIKVTNYSTNETILISLDDKISLKDNALQFYKKYKKYKNSIDHINEQINICNEHIEYLSSIIFQINDSNVESLEQIKTELNEQNLIHTQNNKKTSKRKINLEQFIIDDVIISVGKNNIQNEFLTFNKAKFNDYFFHVQNYSGAHVIIHSNNLNEKLIRFAANLAAYHSQARYSSSVPVQYTLVKNVKKIPGGKPGKVLLKNYKLIYIDPIKNF